MRSQGVAAAAILASLTLSIPVTALYHEMEARQVPVERLVANLERELQEDQRNIQKVTNLARLHGMAYALKSRELPATQLKKDQPEQPWYGHESRYVPPRVVPATSSAQASEAQVHLKKALQYYAKALTLDPANLVARLGHAWMLDQSGQKTEAITEYRSLIEQVWKTEQKAAMAVLGQRFFTEEAAGYLIPLLDPKKDAAEIAELQARRDRLQAMPRPITPIAIPLEDNLTPRTMLDPLARVRFDADGSGLRREWTWIVPEAGWLVYDADGNGSITSALQWFGNVTFWLFWNNGYEALGALDDNGDGELAGIELQHLAIWQDRNRDGLSDTGEVRPLAAHGIIALSCNYVDDDGVRVVATSPLGARFADGRTRPTYDLVLRRSSSSLTKAMMEKVIRVPGLERSVQFSFPHRDP